MRTTCAIPLAIVALAGLIARGTALAGEEITITLPGGVPLVLVKIPKGTFLMGSPDSERGRGSDEIQHQVTISQDYYLGKYEVTQQQWYAVMADHPSYVPCGPDCPVENTKWNDICGGPTGSVCAPTSFIGKVNQLLGTTKFRLPTEAEWERAARGGTTTRYSYGDALECQDTLCEGCATHGQYMWYCGNALHTTHPVGQTLPNPYGLYDIHGNVSEWVADWYGDYPSLAVTDPSGPSTGQVRVFRGSSWTGYAGQGRSAERVSSSPSNWWADVGFRLARSAAEIAYTYSYWVPVASHGSGANKSQWRSDLGLLNPGAAVANYEARWYSGGAVKTGNGYVPAKAQLIHEDIVAQLGGSGNGALEVRSDQLLTVTSRTYNLVAQDASCYANGTLGQDYPAFQVADGLSAGQTANIGQLTESKAFRTNIGLTNAGAGAATVTVELNDGAGTQLTTYTVTLNPGEFKQESRPFFNKAGQTAMQRGWAKVTVNSGAGVYAHGSVVDNITNDPSTVPMVKQP
jgi:formylglycine-generating enzyme required for sulfatase activity